MSAITIWKRLYKQSNACTVFTTWDYRMFMLKMFKFTEMLAAVRSDVG